MRYVVLLSLVLTARGALAFEITSPAFTRESNIPTEHTCDGADASPSLHWTETPEGTKSFALIVDDPDAPVGTWVHWVIYNLAASMGGLASGIPTPPELDQGIRQGLTDFGRTGYGGPCPPPGRAHRYYFKLYALDAPLDLPARQTKAELLRAMDGHILGEASTMGTYERKG